jgi:cellulose synthase (UDP-forming)
LTAIPRARSPPPGRVEAHVALASGLPRGPDRLPDGRRHLAGSTAGAASNTLADQAIHHAGIANSKYSAPLVAPAAVPRGETRAHLRRNLISIYLDGFSKDFDIKAHRRLVRRWRPAVKPGVDVFLPVRGEPIEVLHTTWTHVRRLAAAHGGEVATYVLDDAADPEVEAMARHFGFAYVVRPNRGWFKKAGNLHHAFGLTHGEHVLILDADFAPRPDLLDELLPHMDDERTGIVQSPQFFRITDRQNWIERGAGAVQEQFCRSVQTSHEDKDGSICVGSCAVYRRAALEQIGGISLIEHSEDMYTGFDLRALGWKLRYVPAALSAGVCPDSAGAFHNQQYRWCMASLSLLTSKRFWDMPMRFKTRLCYVSAEAA